MPDEKRYFWLKLYDDFFDSLRIKRLRKLAGGDTYLIIYLKLQLKAMKNEGVLEWKHYDKDIIEELAIDLDEEPDNIRVTLAYLKGCGLAESNDDERFFFPYSVINVCSEGASAQRMREVRARAKEAAKLEAPSQNGTLCAQSATKCELSYGEIDIESEKESDNCSDLPSGDSEPAVYRIILNDKSYHDVTPSDIERYKELYPNADIDQEMRKIIGWCESNPTKRKTRRGVKAFITNWLSRAQDRGPKQQGPKKSKFDDL